MAASASSDEDARVADLMAAVEAQVGPRSRGRDDRPGRAFGLFGCVALVMAGAAAWLSGISNDTVVDGWGLDPLALVLYLVLVVGTPVLILLFGAFLVLSWRAYRSRGESEAAR